MTSPVPEDVMEKAREVARDVKAEASFDDRSDYPGIDWTEGNVEWIVARAILAERERCARIAETCGFETLTMPIYERQAEMARKGVAAAIRGTHG